MLKMITPLQWLGVVILFNTTLIGGATQLPDLGLGTHAVKFVLALATLGNGFLGGLVTMFGGVGAMRNTLGNHGDLVFTNRTTAEASPSANVLAITPAIAAAANAAGATAPPVQ